jgi:Rrf2 family cysteine metabolism transcriptional repressor
MRVSKKAYYGLRAVAALARHGGELSVHELAHAEEMPEDYLHKILQSLRKAKLVIAAKGQGGGYSLARDTTDISVWDIVTALDGGFHHFSPPKLTRTSPYPKLTHCQTNQIWKALEHSIETTLEKMTLAQLLVSSHKNHAPEK